MRYFLLNEKDQEDILSAIRILNIKLLELFLERELMPYFVEQELKKMKARSKRERKDKLENTIKKQNEIKKILDQEYESISF
jgi:hypothetical protein